MKSNRWIWVLRLVVATTIFVLLYRYVDFAAVFALLRQADPLLIVAATALFFAGNVLIAHRWNVLLDVVGLRPRLWRVFRAYLKGHFIAYFIPTSVSADIYKAIDIGRETRELESTTSAILIERSLGMLGMASIILFGIVGMEPVLERVGLGGGLALAVVSIVLGFVALIYADHILKAMRGVFNVFGERVAGFFDKLGGALGTYRGHTATLGYAFLVSILIHVGRGFSIWLIGRSMGDTTEFAYYLVFVPLVFILNMLPVAGSRIGVEQGAFVVLFGAVGMEREMALGISVLTVALGFLVALPGGYWLLKKG